MKHAGIPWGVKVAPDSGTEAERRERVANMARNRVWFAPMDGQHELCPELTRWAKEENPNVEVGLSRNLCHVFDIRSDYFPSHGIMADVCDANDGWLNKDDGTPIKTQWSLRLMDIRVEAVRNAFCEQTIELAKNAAADFLFFDECHDERYPRSKGAPITGPKNASDPNGLDWNQSVKFILRRCRMKVVRNGIFPLDDSSMFDGIYVQNAHMKPDLIETLRDAKARGFKRSCIQVPATIDWHALEAEFPNVSIQEIPTWLNQFDFPPPTFVFHDGTSVESVGGTYQIRGRK